MAIPKRGPVIAIDGPAGSGKSTTTLTLAEKLGFVHVDTGALYRSIAFQCLEKGFHFDLDSNGKLDPKLIDEAEHIAKEAHLEFKRDESQSPVNRVFINGEDVTNRIRTPEVSMAASRVSAIPGVRSALLGLQRRLGCEGQTILEGRDIGTVIFPDADLKVFLTASVDARAERRIEDLKQKKAIKSIPSLDEMKKQIKERDQGDSSRSTAPLKKAQDAVEIDTTQLSLNEVVEKIFLLAKERLGLKE